jgi:hypothetical protein
MARASEEKIKLVANALDRASTACLAVGVIAPLAAAFYNIDPAHRSENLILILGTVIWFTAAVALHWLARRTLGKLPP